MDYTVHGILQARILEWVAFRFSRGSSQPEIEPRSLALLVDSLPTELSGKAKWKKVIWILKYQGSGLVWTIKLGQSQWLLISPKAGLYPEVPRKGVGKGSLPGTTRAELATSSHFLLELVTQSCLTLCDPMDCSPPGSSVHGILQARILEWVAISSSRGSSQPSRDRTCNCYLNPTLVGRFFTTFYLRGFFFFFFGSVKHYGVAQISKCSKRFRQGQACLSQPHSSQTQLPSQTTAADTSSRFIRRREAERTKT